MADTYTTSLRFQLQAVGGNNNQWGTIADTQYTLIEQAITGDNGYSGGSGGISIGGLTTYTLTVAQGTTDQARQKLYPFVGALTSACTVTLPGVVKIGWALNATTGGQNVVLTVGGGGTITLPPGSGWTFFYCDGVNVTAPTMAFGTLTAGAGTFTTLTAGAGGSFARSTATANASQALPGGMTLQFGYYANSSFLTQVNISFSSAFPTSLLTVNCTALNNTPTSNNAIGVYSTSTSGFTANLAQALSFYWIAIGY